MKCPWWQGKKIGCFIYRVHCTLLLGGIVFKIEDKGFKWQSGFTPVTLTRNFERFVLKMKKNILGKVSGKFETFGRCLYVCIFFPESLAILVEFMRRLGMFIDLEL